MISLMVADVNRPQSWRRYLAFAAVALMPLSFNIEKYLKNAKEPFYLSPLDLLLPLLLVLMLLDLFQRRPFARFKTPPLSGLLWAGLAILSCLWMDGFFEAMRRYLESRSVRIGPDFEAWATYEWAELKHYARRRDALSLGSIEERAKRYCEMQMELDSWRRYQHEIDAEAWWSQLDDEG